LRVILKSEPWGGSAQEVEEEPKQLPPRRKEGQKKSPCFSFFADFAYLAALRETGLPVRERILWNF